MLNRNNFFAAVVVLCSALFALNFFHQSQQTIYTVRYVTLAESLLEQMAYLDGAGNIASYPMWGYAALVAATNSVAGDQGILIFQYLLLLASFALIVRMCPLPGLDRPLDAVIFYGALLFYTMLLSVKWPAAIVGFLLLAFAVSHQRQHYLLAAVMLLIVYNFRTEGLGLWGLYVAYLLISRTAVPWRSWALIAMVSTVLIGAWPTYQYTQNKQFTLTTSNSGGVLYMSLGQLPNNPWDRVYDDHAVIADAKAMGIGDPWGFEGNARLKQQFFDDVREHPGSFLKKVLYVYLQIFKGGLYVTETRTLAVRGNQAKDLEQRALASEYQSQPTRLIRDLFTFRFDAWLLAVQLALTLLSVVYLALVLGLLVWRVVTRRVPLINPYLWLIGGKLGLAGLVQYEPRHMSGVLLLFVLVLLPRRGDGQKQPLTANSGGASDSRAVGRRV